MEAKADDPAAHHPAEGGACAQGAELAFWVMQLGKNNAAGHAPDWSGDQGLDLGTKKHQFIAEPPVQGEAGHAEGEPSQPCQPAHEASGCHSLICQSADKERRNECCYSRGGEHPGNQVSFFIGREDVRERNTPDAHRHRSEKEEQGKSGAVGGQGTGTLST